jgi:hypothetical protein
MDVIDRILDKVDMSGDCWVWTGCRGGRGYGMIRINYRNIQAHRVVYEELVEPIPEGLQLDHLCRNKACVNPDHLEPVTNEENMRRYRATLTHCPNGHEYMAENIAVQSNGTKRCRTCKKNNRQKKVI